MKSKTTLLTKEAALKGRQWKIVDASGLALGRVSTQVAMLLRGKHKPEFTPSVDCGDFVIVTNAEKVTLSGNKWEDKKYYKHSGYVGGLKERSAKEVKEKNPERLIENAVKGMLPKTRLGKKIIRNLKVYAGSEHPHTAQKPEVVEL